MGMFDSVQFNMRLPVKKDAEVRTHGNPFQSKSVQSWMMPHLRPIADHHGALTITVTENGQLEDHTGNLLDWTGTLNFYGPVPRRYGWIEFNATVQGGIVRSVKRA